MNIVGIIGSIFIGIGCFLPWLQYGVFFGNGLTNQYSLLLIVGSTVSGMLAIYNQTKSENRNLWIYTIIGVAGLVIIFIYIYDLNSKWQEPANALAKLNSFSGNKDQISIMNLLGPGIYLVGVGSVALIISGFGIFKPNEGKVSMNIDRIEVIAPQNIKEISEELDPIEQANVEYKKLVILLNGLIIKERGSMFAQSNRREIKKLLTELSSSIRDGNHLINVYTQLFQSNLVDDIKNTTSNYEGIQDLLEPLIIIGLVDNKYPHKLKGP